MSVKVVEIKFRLPDGSDLGPKTFPVAASVATLKESIIQQWPKDKENSPKTVKEVKLISSGRILENAKTIRSCQSSLFDVTDEVITMHVVIQRPPSHKVRKTVHPLDHNKCVCSIM